MSSVYRVDSEGFQECSLCSGKPGTPLLCESCIQNRHRIHALSEQVRKLIVEKDRQTEKRRQADQARARQLWMLLFVLIAATIWACVIL